MFMKMKITHQPSQPGFLDTIKCSSSSRLEINSLLTLLFWYFLQGLLQSSNPCQTDVIRKAFQATEEGFISLVARQWSIRPQLAAVGSCCLVGVICGGNLYIANLGDSRAVLGRLVKATGDVLAIQLSAEHNACIESVRQELHSLHPDDNQIVVLKHNVWRVRGLIQVTHSLHEYWSLIYVVIQLGQYEGMLSNLNGTDEVDLMLCILIYEYVPLMVRILSLQITRSIGDVYLKKAEFNREPLIAKFRLREPFRMPILSSDPAISVHPLQPHDQFVIFASDGLWEHLSNQEAVDIVQSHPRNGSAKRLVKAALQEAAKKREMRYSDLKKIDRGVRRHFHDDITVIVVFLDSNLVSRASSVKCSNISVRGGGINLPANTLAPFATPTEAGST
ncbi:putative protein phosphatase 2C 28 [Vitis vinifera]|uniref:PPM-type phosphatase domain-containing protein n=1 Tax=Vitis vinifera TaxID=29760 RepID=A0A438DST0_VITVI|nr:putative protein phosphatase 2C 28 [Vitis vinifera]